MEIEQQALAEPNLLCALGEERSVLGTIVIFQNYCFAVTLCEWRMLPAMVLSRGCFSHPATRITVVSLRELGGRQGARHQPLAAAAPCPPQQGLWGDPLPPAAGPLRRPGVRMAGFWPQTAEVQIKGMVLVSPDSCTYLPIHGKVLNSLTWDVWLSLIGSHLLLFCAADLCCRNSWISWPLPCFFRAVPPLLCPGLKSSVLSTEL